MEKQENASIEAPSTPKLPDLSLLSTEEFLSHPEPDMLLGIADDIYDTHLAKDDKEEKKEEDKDNTDLLSVVSETSKNEISLLRQENKLIIDKMDMLSQTLLLLVNSHKKIESDFNIFQGTLDLKMNRLHNRLATIDTKIATLRPLVTSDDLSHSQKEEKKKELKHTSWDDSENDDSKSILTYDSDDEEYKKRNAAILEISQLSDFKGKGKEKEKHEENKSVLGMSYQASTSKMIFSSLNIKNKEFDF